VPSETPTHRPSEGSSTLANTGPSDLGEIGSIAAACLFFGAVALVAERRLRRASHGR
jgi:hypothetical protein